MISAYVGQQVDMEAAIRLDDVEGIVTQSGTTEELLHEAHRLARGTTECRELTAASIDNSTVPQVLFVKAEDVVSHHDVRVNLTNRLTPGTTECRLRRTAVCMCGWAACR